MQKNDKYYTFLLKHSYKTRIFIKRVEVSQKQIRTGLVSFALILGIFTAGAGITGIVNNNSTFLAGLIDRAETAQAQTTLSATTALPGSIDYSRPADSKNVSFNSGGPFSSDAGSEDAEMERRTAAIRSTGDPAVIPSSWAHMCKITSE